MLQFISSPGMFISTLSIFLLGAFFSLFFIRSKQKAFANIVAHGFPILGSLFGIALASGVLWNKLGFWVTLQNPGALFAFTFRIDALAAFFILIISVVTLATSIFGHGYISHIKNANIGALGFFYNIFITSLLLVVTANNAVLFLIAWELMSLASFFLIIFEREKEENIRAGFIYFLMTQVGTALIAFAFLLLYGATNSFDFDAFRTAGGALSVGLKNMILLSALLGLGIKAGVVPLHIWLPKAHPAAPSHVSALLSGVMLKMAIFMMIRFLFEFLAPVPALWGIALIFAGALSCILGVLYALMESDIKRLLAFCSVENIGIILISLGAAVLFASLYAGSLAGLALAAALFHTMNHALFKGLLFLGAGSVVSATGTRNMERYGGLIKTIPVTAFFFLIGAVAISGLPPFNGFASELLILKTLFAGASMSGVGFKIIFVSAIGVLALTSGLAAATFVKLFGTTFLARARSEEALAAKESPLSMQIGMGILGVLCILSGIFAARVLGVLLWVVNTLGLQGSPVLSSFQDAVSGSASNTLSLSALALLMLLAFALVFFVVHFVTLGRKEKIYSVWDCGAPIASPRTEINATGFSRTLLMIFSRITRPVKSVVTTAGESTSPYFAEKREVDLSFVDVWQKYVYAPIGKGIQYSARMSKNIQNGSEGVYLLYIFLVIIILLAVSF